MLLTHSTWQEVESYLKRSTAIVVPIGSTEQHGPLGVIGTDAITAEAIATGVGDKSGALVGPALALSVAQFNLAFPGTVSLRASTLMSLIEDYVLSLKQQGFERFYFLNGHGANLSAARSAFQDVYSKWSLGTMQGVPPRCRIRSWWEYPQVDALRKEWYGASEGMHATPSEIAMTLHLLPGSARKVDASTPPEALDAVYLRDHGGDNHWDAATHRARFPDGRVGSHSALATADQGRQLFEAAIDGACDDLAAFIAEV